MFGDLLESSGGCRKRTEVAFADLENLKLGAKVDWFVAGKRGRRRSLPLIGRCSIPPLVSDGRAFLRYPSGVSPVPREQRLSFRGLTLLLLQVDKRSQSFCRRVVLAVQEWEDALAPPPPLLL